MPPVTDFRTLYQRHAPDVFRFALYLTGNHHDAEDVTSETFVRAWTAPGEIRADTVRAYLCTIARNLCLKSLRGARRQAALDDSLRDPREDPALRVERSLELQRTLDALQRLPELDRAALVMRAMQELPYAEIAQALGLSPGAVRVRVHRARLALLRLEEIPSDAPARPPERTHGE